MVQLVHLALLAHVLLAIQKLELEGGNHTVMVVGIGENDLEVPGKRLLLRRFVLPGEVEDRKIHQATVLDGARCEDLRESLHISACRELLGIDRLLIDLDLHEGGEIDTDAERRVLDLLDADTALGAFEKQLSGLALRTDDDCAVDHRVASSALLFEGVGCGTEAGRAERILRLEAGLDRVHVLDSCSGLRLSG